MKLFFRKTGQGKPLIILHGLLGSSDNWVTVSKALEDEFEVCLIDQRNHGQSPHSAVFDYPSMANDLKHFIDTHHLVDPIILGHSMGGKVAMEYAIANPKTWSKLVVVDIAPKSYPIHHDAILKGLNGLDLRTIKSRLEADRLLAADIPEAGVRQFLLKNLKRDTNGFSWRMNLPVITANIENVGAETKSSLVVEHPVLFINGENSDYVLPEDRILIKKIFTNSTIVTVKKAGHWVHAEQQEAFLAVLKPFLSSND